jgi:hypothetical protein
MIRFSCSCGKQLVSKDANAGQRVRCPECGTRLTVPDEDGEAEFDRPSRPRRRRPRERERSHTGLIVGGIVAGVVAVGAVVAVILIVTGKGDDAKDTQGAGGGGGNVLAGGDTGGPRHRISRLMEGRSRAATTANLKQIAIAMHSYNDTYRRLPPAVVYGADHKPLYSWRVLLLPFLEHQALYQQFHLNEPWDSPQNKTLLGSMPRTYAFLGDENTGETHCMVIDGEQAAFNSNPKLGFRPFNGGQTAGQLFEAGMASAIPRTFLDGTSNTILVVEADEAVPWTKPADLPFGPGQALPKLGGLYESGNFVVALADGSTRTLNRQSISETTLRAAMTASGGEQMGADWHE